MAEDQAPRRCRVAFVCVRNSCRSQMAEAFARAYAADIVDPSSAGTEPAQGVDPFAVQVMRELGIDISRARPKALMPEAASALDLVVHMGCGSERCLVVPGVPAEEWHIEDPAGKGIEAYRRVREAVRESVVDLAARLRASGVCSAGGSPPPSPDLRLR